MMEQVINELTYFIWLQTKLWIQMMANYSNILKNEWFEMIWNELKWILFNQFYYTLDLDG